MDHISDSFLETNVPLLVLIEAAKSGNEKEVKEYAQVFREHANKLVEVSLRFLLLALICRTRGKHQYKLDYKMGQHVNSSLGKRRYKAKGL